MDYSKFRKIDTFIFDVDGVLTDSSLHITETGNLLRMMNVKDGSVMKKALKSGYKVAIITKGNSVGVRKRLEILGAHPIYDCVEDKEVALQDMVNNHGIDPMTSLYMGDDRADLVLADKVLLFCAPNDAASSVLKAAEFISHKKGGAGCVRDIIERVMRVQGDLSN